MARAMYNFTEAAEERVPGQRRKGFHKREAREVLDIVRGLTAMTGKQLLAVTHLLPLGTLEAVGIASKLPRSNQGRKRQEALVAKMLRGQLTELQLEKLGDAVDLSTRHDATYDDTDISGMVEAWREGLLEDDPAVVAEVYGYQTAWALDHQQLATLARQCQQALEEERAAAPPPPQEAAAGGPDGEADAAAASSDSEEEEDLAAVLADAAKRGIGKSKRRRQKPPAPRSRALLRSLTRALRPMVQRVVKEAADKKAAEEEGEGEGEEEVA